MNEVTGSLLAKDQQGCSNATETSPNPCTCFDMPTNFATKFLKSCHALHLTSYVCTRLRIIFATHSSPMAVFSIAW